MYGKVTGKYLGYGPKESAEKWTLKQEAQSEATITYIRGNILNIEVTEYPVTGKYKWIGVITMDLATYGSVAWHYEIIEGQPFGDNKHEFGFKRIMIQSKDHATYVYLVEEGPGTYGKEIFIKQNSLPVS